MSDVGIKFGEHEQSPYFPSRSDGSHGSPETKRIVGCFAQRVGYFGDPGAAKAVAITDRKVMGPIVPCDHWQKLVVTWHKLGGVSGPTGAPQEHSDSPALPFRALREHLDADLTDALFEGDRPSAAALAALQAHPLVGASAEVDLTGPAQRSSIGRRPQPRTGVVIGGAPACIVKLDNRIRELMWIMIN